MAFNLNDYSEEEKYDLFRRVINRFARLRGERQVGGSAKSTTRKAAHPFIEESGRINLLGVRGMKNGRVLPKDTVTSFDDTLFVIYRDEKGGKRVRAYQFATDTEYLNKPNHKASAHLIEGQHRYVLGAHHWSSPTYCKLTDVQLVYGDDGKLDKAASKNASDDWSKWRELKVAQGPLAGKSDFDSHHKEGGDYLYAYRALVPEDAVLVRREYGGEKFLGELESGAKRGDQYGDIEEEGYDPQGGINIHHASYRYGPQSLGCQTMPGWNNYRDFFWHVEQDFSIAVKRYPASSSVPARRDFRKPFEEELGISLPDEGSGERPVIYTLVRGDFVEEVAQAEAVQVRLPFEEGPTVTPQAVDSYYTNNEAGSGGWYPVGANQTWHNGIHLSVERGQVVRAVAPGRIVAARFARNDEGEVPFGSPGFVLIKHRAASFPAAPVDANAKVGGESKLGRVTAEVEYVRDLESGRQAGKLAVGAVVELVEDPASEGGSESSSPNGTMTFSEEEAAYVQGWRKCRVYGTEGEEPAMKAVWINEIDTLKGESIRMLPAATTPMKIATNEDEGRGLNCRARTDLGDDNVIGVISEGTEVQVYDQRIHADGDVWQAVRAPDQDISFGWIVTSEGRVQPVEGDTQTTTEFYSLYMNVAWEAPGRSQSSDAGRTPTIVPWMLPYYPHIFDETLDAPYAASLGRITREVEGTFEPAGDVGWGTFYQNDIVEPVEYSEGGDRVRVRPFRQSVTGIGSLWIPADAMRSFPAGVEVGRIETGEGQGGLNLRAYTDFPPSSDKNVIGNLQKGKTVLLSKVYSSTENNREWRLASWLLDGGTWTLDNFRFGWVAADGSDGALNVDVPQAFKQTAKKLKQGTCVKLDIPVKAGEPIANVGRLPHDQPYGVHLEVFSEENVFNEAHIVHGGWRVVEDDSDKDVICESKQAMRKMAQQLEENDAARSLLEKIGWGGTEASTREDVEAVRRQVQDDLPSLHTLITRNTSYWAIDWGKVKKKNEAWAAEFDIDDSDVQTAQKHTWWEKCQKKEVDLPDAPLLFHYHPVAFLEYLDDQLPEPQTTETAATAIPPEKLRRRYHTLEDQEGGQPRRVQLLEYKDIDLKFYEDRARNNEYMDEQLRQYRGIDHYSEAGEIERDKWIYVFRQEPFGPWKLDKELRTTKNGTFEAVPWRQASIREWDRLRTTYEREAGDERNQVYVDTDNYSYRFVLSPIQLPYDRIKYYCDYASALEIRGVSLGEGSAPNMKGIHQDEGYYRLKLIDYLHIAEAFHEESESAIGEWKKVHEDAQEQKRRYLARMVWRLHQQRKEKQGEGFSIRESVLREYIDQQDRFLTKKKNKLERATTSKNRWIETPGLQQAILDYGGRESVPEDKQEALRKAAVEKLARLHADCLYSQAGRAYLARASEDEASALHQFVTGEQFAVMSKTIATTGAWTDLLSSFLSGRVLKLKGLEELSGELSALDTNSSNRRIAQEIGSIVDDVNSKIPDELELSGDDFRTVTRRGGETAARGAGEVEWISYRLGQDWVQGIGGRTGDEWVTVGRPGESASEQQELAKLKRESEEWKTRVEGASTVTGRVLAAIEFANMYSAASAFGESLKDGSDAEQTLKAVDVLGTASGLFESNEFIIKRFWKDAPFRAAGVVSGICDYVLALEATAKASYKAAEEPIFSDEGGLVAANAMQAIGVGLGTAGTVAGITGTATAFGVSTSLLGPIGAALVLGGVALAYWLSESALEDWMRDECIWGTNSGKEGAVFVDEYSDQEVKEQFDRAWTVESQLRGLHKVLAKPEVEGKILYQIATDYASGPDEYNIFFGLIFTTGLFYPEKSAIRVKKLRVDVESSGYPSVGIGYIKDSGYELTLKGKNDSSGFDVSYSSAVGDGEVGRVIQKKIKKSEAETEEMEVFVKWEDGGKSIEKIGRMYFLNSNDPEISADYELDIEVDLQGSGEGLSYRFEG